MKKTLLLGISICLSIISQAATITVTNTNNGGAGSLRQALLDANNGDIINFSVTGVIMVSNSLNISKNVTIQGPGADVLAIDGNNTTTIFRDFLNTINTVEISGLEIRNGSSSAYGAGIRGLGINLKLKYCNIHSHTLSAGYGAAISIWRIGSSLTIENSALHNNTVSGFAAGIYIQDGGDLNISNSTLYNNKGNAGGQAILAQGSDISFTNVTIAGHNTGTSAIIIEDYEDFSTSTIVKEGSLTIVNSIIDNPIVNISSFGASGPLISRGYNISNDRSTRRILRSINDLNETSSLLDPLGIQNNGGTVPTIGLQCDSPAIDRGSLVLPLDQIGSIRYGSGPDIGAYESNNIPVGIDTITECNAYTWIDGKTYTESNNSAMFTIIGGAANGCDSIASLNLTINTAPALRIDTITECNSYTWIDGNTYTESNNSATFKVPEGAANGCDSIVSLDLIINKISDLTTSVSGTTITSNNNSASYQWIDCDNDNAIIIGETGKSYTPSTTGNYAVTLTENGCVETTACVTVEVLSVVDEENDFGDKLLVYPNPTKGKFFVNLGDEYETSQISITDISGKILYSETTNNQSQILNLSLEESAGVYFVSIRAGDKKAKIRLIKK
ncbi:T9SS type A sorting domain-containing protein [Aquimarina algicola]|uniref:T9SS type A sorting domain-containing protein n=1 Tax=Aquimarina algicola TaxID=2589995 RepID=A0A504JCD6_9FLAO|nr:T9SS type A sorting domain-containing protein [Aquimarina algicola]TPN85243.1 T9SS type A sorting domain-containing protein [Aquimarina algicola]